MRSKYSLFWLVLIAVVLLAAACAPASTPVPADAATTPEAAAPAAATPEAAVPTEAPTVVPTTVPTEAPTAMPTEEATVAPTAEPTAAESAGVPVPTLLPDVPQSAEAIQRISAEELKALLDGGADLVVVDARGKSDYSEGYIPGARNLPWAEEIVGVRLFPTDKLLILYDAGSDDQSAAGVAMQLIEKHGFTQLMLLEGGLQRWLDELGYPYEKSLSY